LLLVASWASPAWSVRRRIFFYFLFFLFNCLKNCFSFRPLK
jgi:hypothetical protein